MNLEDIGELEQRVPDGFHVEAGCDGSVIIHFRRTGMGCMNLFLLVWLIFWTFGCILLIYQYVNPDIIEGGEPTALWFSSIFWVAEIVVACLLVYLVFARKVFLLSADKLIMVTKVLKFTRHKVIARDSIRLIRQVKDGGENDDSFPSWGLQVDAGKKTTLIFRQPHEKSLWLGQLLAHWAQVEFSSLPED